MLPWVHITLIYSTYRPGTSNADADPMSRHPSLMSDDTETGLITNEVIEATSKGIQYSTCIESISMSATTLGAISNVTCDKRMDVARAQKQDPVLSRIPLVEARRKPQRQELPNSQDH